MKFGQQLYQVHRERGFAEPGREIIHFSSINLLTNKQKSRITACVYWTIWHRQQPLSESEQMEQSEFGV